MTMTAPERFILIDDNEADNVYHEIMIRRAGFTGDILVFESGIEALAFDAAKGRVICGQAIVKTIESTTYSESLDLSVL